jgi:hypothetical protein
MAYCCRCGVFAALDDATMCARCRDNWRPAGPVPADLGCHGQPQPLGAGHSVIAVRPAARQVARAFLIALVTRAHDQPVLAQQFTVTLRVFACLDPELIGSHAGSLHTLRNRYGTSRPSRL